MLQEIYNQLTYGELSHLAIGGANIDGGIHENDRPKIINHIQLGLTALYKRFRLKEDEVIVELQEDQNTYYLDCDYAVSNTESTEPVKYLLDTDNPFTGRILKVERVYDDLDYELLLNKRDNPCSLRTPTDTTLFIPELVRLRTVPDPPIETVKVVYRANHPVIDVLMGQYAPNTIELELPQTHMEPLLYYIASRLHNPIGMVNEFHSGNSYYAKYEAACMQLEINNYEIDNIGQEYKFEQRGFV